MEPTSLTLQEVMPWWTGWLGPAAYLAMAAVWLLLIPGMVIRQARRRVAGATDWPEKAAHASDARLMITVGLFLWLPIAIGQRLILLGSFSRIPAAVLGATFGVAAVTLTLYSGWRFVRVDLEQPVPGFVSHVAGSLRRWWPALTLLALAFLAPARLSSPWMIPWTVLAVAGLFGLRYMAEAWTLSGVAEPATGRVAAIVESAAARFGADPPAAYVLDTHAANAVALPVRNLVIITRRLVDLLEDEELEAIVLHEIAHLNESKQVTRIRSLGTLVYLPILALKPLIGTGIIALVVAVAIVGVVSVIVQRVSAREEARADHAAVEASHESAALGYALLKAHKAAYIPSVVNRDPHGPLHERLQRAGIEPDFEPVASKPRLRRLILAIVLYFVILVVPLFSVAFTIDVWDGDSGAHTALALGWQEEDVLWYTGLIAAEEGDPDVAIPYLRESADRGDIDALSDLPWVLGQSGRCEEVPAAADELVAAGGSEEAVALAESWATWCLDANR